VKTILTCVAGIAFMLFAVSQRPDSVDDFRAFYRGGVLMAAHESVYSHPFAFPDKQADASFLPFIRIPSYAAALRPFAALRYPVARGSWLALSVLAFIGCVWLFPGNRDHFLLALSFSFPLAYTFVLGQDIGFILLIALLAIRLFSKEYEFAAGLAASLMAIKVSYLPAVGVVFVAKSRKGTLGLAAGVAVQLALSFALSGSAWPADFLTILRNPLLDTEPRRMPNLRAIAAGLALPDAMVAIACLACVVCLWFLCRRLDFADAVTVALPMVLIILPHCYIYDAVVLIPLLVSVVSMESWDGILPVIGLTPLPYLLLMSETPISVLAGSTSIVVITLAGVARLYKMRTEQPFLTAPVLA
jgi:hypothetical protein